MNVRTALVICLGMLAAVSFGEETVAVPEYDALHVGGGGTVALMHRHEAETLRAFDLGTRKERFRIDQVPKGALIGAGAGDLVVVSPGTMMMQRFDLKTGKREKVALLGGTDAPGKLVLGSASEGPLFLYGAASAHVLDLQTLKPAEVKSGELKDYGRHGISLLASADGKTIGRIPTGYGPVGYAVTQWSETGLRRVKFGSTSNAIRWAQPTADGRLLLLPNGEVRTRNGRELPTPWLEGAALIPSSDPALFLALKLDERDAEDRRVVKLSVCSTSDGRPLFHHRGYTELLPKRISSWHDIVGALRSGDTWRVVHLPEQKELLTFPNSNDRMVFRSFDVDERMRTEDLSKLVVTSAPPVAVRRNGALRYEIAAKFFGGAPKKEERKLSFELVDGPEGAKINKKGVLAWKVPEALLEERIRFLVAVRTGGEGGAEALHGFEVDVLRP